jgi:UDP-GlcNAc3NAcA epimerase
LKIITIVGARPQFIKAAAVSRAITMYSSFEEKIIHTGQHYDENMSDVFFREMEIPKPAFNLGINAKSHAAMTGEMMAGLEKIYLKEKPDLVIVYGDTNSTLAGSLTAVKIHIPVAHVEAGLRSFNMMMPEEVNRILTDRISNYLFCPTETAVKNLELEGYKNFDSEVIFSGDVMQDAALYYSQTASMKSNVIEQNSLKEFILCTIHRAENTDNLGRLNSILDAINKINENIQVVIPLHPRTRKIIENSGLKCNATVIDPVGYFDMITLLKQCKMVMTDSGGLQKEAYFFSKNCVTLRDETEWTELVDGGFNELAGADSEKITIAINKMLLKNSNFNKDLYGGGNASLNIVNYLSQKFS